MPTATKTWQQKATAKAIVTKVNRKKNPVRSLVQLAEEFGAPVHGPYTQYGYTASGRTASGTFRNHVKTVVGSDLYNKVRNMKQVRS